jgi:hypothetical protein
MKTDLHAACEKTGFYAPHAEACQTVAERTNCIILFREPGGMAQGLIAENYSMKGFRIDTKSCNWGPMSGFVCADPRLTKDPSYIARNAGWTKDALTGHIHERWFGKVEDKTWVGDVMPIVISEKRTADLRAKGLINPKPSANGEWVGVSRAMKGDTILYWRLVPVGNAGNSWLKGGKGYLVLCVDRQGAAAFHQIYPENVEPIKFRGHETILGLINPGTKDRGFKACATADYDMFAIWEGMGKSDRLGLQHRLAGELQKNFGQPNAPLPGGVARMDTVDTRLQAGGHREHHRFGDVSARVMYVKTMLNTALQTAGGYHGGNAVHHNDEAGNFALAKGSLSDCLPLIGFLPGPQTVLVENLPDFKELALYARERGFNVRAKAEWLLSAGVPA